MKKNLNVIQINGLRGLLISGMIVACLCAGFVVFPGWVFMHLWNYSFKYLNAQYMLTVPNIGLIQGILLWGMIAVTYFTFRKNKFIVCVKTPQGLSDEELKSVFADLKDQAKEEMIIKSMLKAREAELKLKSEQSDEMLKDEQSSSDEDKQHLDI